MHFEGTLLIVQKNVNHFSIMWDQIPPDPIFNIYGRYLEDPRPSKINAAIGILLQNQKGYVMPSVQQAATHVKHDDYGYLPIGGDRSFLEWVRDLYLPSEKNDCVALQQTAGGTHACWIMDQIGKRCGWGPFLIPIPTWDNYFVLLEHGTQTTFPHINKKCEIDWNAYKNAIESADEGSVLILQATGAHNPTGKNLNEAQRDELIQMVNKRKIWVYMDGAYIGLAAGLKADTSWVSNMWKGVDQVMLGVSFSKTATMYGHRLGALMIKCPDASQAKAMESYMQAAMRGSISMPPRWGSLIMQQVQKNYASEWEEDINRIQNQLARTRKILQKLLTDEDAPSSWITALDGEGLFALLPLSSETIEQIVQKHGLYIFQNGRINISGFIGCEQSITHLLADS